MWQRLSAFVLAHKQPVFGLLTVLVLFLAYRLATKALRVYLARGTHKAENAQNFLFFWRYGWLAVGAVLVVSSVSGSIAALGISAAFVGMVLGWSLQAPVTGIAAWLMIILKRPFRLGDRIIIAGIVGDVVDITLTHVVMNQVGGTVGGEEKSGRGVLIPNAILFQQVIYNYAFETKYILDEVPVLITYESDCAAAEQICLDAAREVTGEIIRDSGKEPFVRRELADSGIRVRVRYSALAVERQRISSDIVGAIIDRFNATDKVEFAYPHTEVLHRPKLTGPQAAIPRPPDAAPSGT